MERVLEHIKSKAMVVAAIGLFVPSYAMGWTVGRWQQRRSVERATSYFEWTQDMTDNEKRHIRQYENLVDIGFKKTKYYHYPDW